MHKQIVDFSKHSMITVFAIFAFVSETVLTSVNLYVLVFYFVAIACSIMAFFCSMLVNYTPILDANKYAIAAEAAKVRKKNVAYDPSKLSERSLMLIGWFNLTQSLMSLVAVLSLAASLTFLMKDNYDSRNEVRKIKVVPCSQFAPYPPALDDEMCVKLK
ncbi:hypothetical protein [Vibrio sp. MA40-2]|uniref:hypothetical protein n=1 Tax=Vibrio sp. MA40-2 TaxID=3391828 RepID=UPI0039A64375